MVEIFSFATATQDNSEYLLNESVRLRIQPVVVKKHEEHIVEKNQQFSSRNFNTGEWKLAMYEELGQMEDTMVLLYDEMVLIQQDMVPLIGI